MNSFLQRYKPQLQYVYRFQGGERVFSFLEKRVFKNINCAMLITTDVGIKPINQLMNSDHFNDIIIHATPDLPIEQCLAEPDFLKDEYTLIGKSVYEMPHYELIRYLDKGLSLADCPYIKRYLNGTLDLRKRPGKINEERLRRIYRKKLKAMDNGELFVVKPYAVDEDTYMVGDGQHTLAMASYFNYPNLRFELIPNLFFDTYFRWLFERIADNDEYVKHNSFFKRANDYRKKQIAYLIEDRFNK